MTNILTVEVICPFCGAISCVDVHEDDYHSWVGGMSVQNAFPYLSATKRELLVSGMCPNCQDDVFGSEDEPSDEDYEDYGPDLEDGFDPYSGCYTYDC